MKRILVLALAVAACTAKSDRADSTDAALPAIDTIKPVVTSDTAAVAGDSVAVRSATPPPTGSTGTKAPTQTRTPATTKGARDSAFPPPRNLPRLDTVGAKKPPR